jgi:uncharacterized protein YjbJ (UPF0337 family)
MNKDILEGNWKQFRGRVQEWWGDLTDDDLDKIQGRSEILAGVLQERYGYTREQAEESIREFLDRAEYAGNETMPGSRR